jgi:hypothetical protein
VLRCLTFDVLVVTAWSSEMVASDLMVTSSDQLFMRVHSPTILSSVEHFEWVLQYNVLGKTDYLHNCHTLTTSSRWSNLVMSRICSTDILQQRATRISSNIRLFKHGHKG